MLYDRLYYATITKANFDKTLHYLLLPNYVASPPLSDNQWTYDEATNAAHIKVNNTMPGYCDERVGFLRIGDIINVSMEVYSISGVKPKISIDYDDDAAFGSFTNSGYVQGKKDNEWETITMKYVVKGNYYHRVVTGIFTADVGEFKMRNIRIEVFSQEKRIKTTEARIAVVRKNVNVWEVRTDFRTDKCIVTEVSANELEITFDEPLYTTKRAGCFVSNEYHTIENNYIARASYSYNNKVKVKFYPTNDLTNEALLSSLPDQTHFTILLIANI